VLVYHDQNHMTPLYAKTLGPYLQRAVDPLIPSAPSGPAG
jgi:hypothetical protein